MKKMKAGIIGDRAGGTEPQLDVRAAGKHRPAVRKNGRKEPM